MAAAWTHSVSSSRQWGGTPDEYLFLHNWFDATKAYIGDFRHRALRHHTLGIAEAISLFGESLTLSTGRVIPMRWVCEQHLIEDFGFIPTLQDWLVHLQPQPWMVRGARKLDAALMLDPETVNDPNPVAEEPTLSPFFTVLAKARSGHSPQNT